MENSTKEVGANQKHYVTIYLKLMFIVYEPIVITIGLIGNLIVMVVMPRKSVKVAATLKFYYVSIAIADFIDIFNSWFLWVILSDTLYLVSGERFSVNLVTLHSFTCKGMVLVWAISEVYSDYSVTAMTIERLIALYFPLKSKAILTGKFTLIMLLITVLPMWAAIVPFIPMVSNIMYNPGTSATGVHCSRDTSHPLYDYYAFAFNAVMNVIHEVLNTFLVMILIAGIMKITISRKHLIQTDNASANVTKIINSAIILMIILIINSIVFLPNFAFGFIYYSVKLEDDNAMIIMGNLYRFFADMIVIAHSLNFFVYYWKIPTFRQATKNFICCCQEVRLQEHSQSV